MVAGSWDHNIYFLDSNGNLLWEYPTQDSIWSVATDASAGYVVAGSQDKNVYFLDSLGNLVWKYPTQDTVWTVDVSRDGSVVIAGSYDDYVYSIKNGVSRWRFKTGDNVLSVAVSDNGDYVATGSWDHNIYFLDSDGRLIWSFPTGGIVGSVAISGDGQYVVAGSNDNKIYTFDSTGRLIGSYRVSNDVLKVDLSRDGRFVAAGSRDGKVYIFELVPEPGATPSFGRLTGQYQAKEEIWGIDISSNGERVVAASMDGNVYILDSNAKLLARHETGGRVTSVALSSDGKRVVAGSYDNNVYFFDVRRPPLDEVEEVEEIPWSSPKVEVVRTIAKAKLLEGEYTTVKLELFNDGGDDAIDIEVEDNPPAGLDVVAGEKAWMGELKPGESYSITYRVRAGESGESRLYELPGLDVIYKDSAGRVYHAFVDPVLIAVESKAPVVVPETQMEEPIELPEESEKPITPSKTQPKDTEVKSLLEFPWIIAGLSSLSILLIWFGGRKLAGRPARIYRKDTVDLLKHLRGEVRGEITRISGSRKAGPKGISTQLFQRIFPTRTRIKAYKAKNIALLKELRKEVGRRVD